MTCTGAMRGVVMVLAALVAGGPVYASTPRHIADADAVASRLAEAARVRAERVQRVQAMLEQPPAKKEAARRGLPVEVLKTRVASLSDAELADLAQRSARVNDVVAGHDSDDALVIAGVVLLVAGVLVLAAAGGLDDDYEDDCYCY